MNEGDRFVDRKERRRIIPYSDMHYSRLEKQGSVPLRIHIGPNRVAWSFRELMDWLETKKAERTAVESGARAEEARKEARAKSWVDRFVDEDDDNERGGEDERNASAKK